MPWSIRPRQADLLSEPAESIMLDDRVRGVPPGLSGIDSRDVARLNWHPARGRMALPVLTMDEYTYVANRDLVLRYIRERGVEIAPHAKTPVCPDLARDLVETGAWGTTVADLRQAAVMTRAGLNRLILANEVGGGSGAARLAAFVEANPRCEIFVFVDSVSGACALADAWRMAPSLPPLPVLIEIGSGRAGTRTIADAETVADAVAASAGRLRFAGIGSYEGNTIQPSSSATAPLMAELIERTAEMFTRLRRRVGPEAELILTAGGSLFFDRIVARLGPVVRQDGRAVLVLRGGAIFFYDHGICARFLAGEGSNPLGGTLHPALRLWADVLSRPEPTLAICGLGMRDASFDQGFPMVLRVHRDGVPLPGTAQLLVSKLNDQHCFLEVPRSGDIQVGDVVEFGVTHACTSIDRHRVIYGIDQQGFVRHAFPTFFG